MSKTVYFDCDDTLVMWYEKMTAETPPITIKNPYQFDDTDIYEFILGINTKNVAALKEHHLNGDLVVVWSRGGMEWAQAVVDALQLGPYVLICLSKPNVYYDDEHYHEWMPAKRSYSH